MDGQEAPHLALNLGVEAHLHHPVRELTGTCVGVTVDAERRVLTLARLGDRAQMEIRFAVKSFTSGVVSRARWSGPRPPATGSWAGIWPDAASSTTVKLMSVAPRDIDGTLPICRPVATAALPAPLPLRASRRRTRMVLPLPSDPSGGRDCSGTSGC